ncbi:Gfo/Idh/MocA family oxidoreductase [Xanthobacter dioxanivorans]|uniref:Gfo/Idh/MocA family oxidoreductase n=1 Tax=Xanthobacter dioxanivorans TaxID=2528964 RepID=A0A974PKP3_9HYPH|nr:Gfo/Idh/MocA family oxidoreductase [Xanthobacter dioxanivorans]QRG05355.1 Gfo/Idh/MocA family oxidoreductase [Xanthobacter dioxanivorans]
MLEVGLAGLGWWGGMMLAALADSPHVRIVAATDLDPGKAAVAARHGVPFVPTFQSLLATPALGGVILCTPQDFHAHQIIAAAAAGKHVFCEKPLCLTRADAERAVAACAAHGRVLGVGHERRFEPPVVELAARIARGDLGTVLQMEGNFSQDKFLALPPGNWRTSRGNPAGPATATGVHLIDLATAILGPAERVLANLGTLATTFENGDTLAMSIRFASGATALLSAILATPFDGRIAVYGSEGWAEVRDKAHPEQSEGWTATYVRRGRLREQIEYPPAVAVRANVEAFAIAAAGGAPYPIATGQMIETVAALEAVFASAATGQPAQVPG